MKDVRHENIRVYRYILKMIVEPMTKPRKPTVQRCQSFFTNGANHFYCKKSTHDGGRTHNLLIRSQTRCHYATRATVCWKFSIINKYIPTLANITIATLRKLYKRFIDRESLFLIFFRKDEHIVQNIIN